MEQEAQQVDAYEADLNEEVLQLVVDHDSYHGGEDRDEPDAGVAGAVGIDVEMEEQVSSAESWGTQRVRLIEEVYVVVTT